MRIACALAALLLAAPAAAQTARQPMQGTAGTAGGPMIAAESACLSELRQAVPDLQRSLGAADRADLRQLRDTAIVFARRGNEDACRTIVMEIDRIAAGAGAGSAVPGATAGRMADARPLAQRAATVSLDDLLDADIMGVGGEYLGEVADVVMVHGAQPRFYAVVDRDGSWFDVGDDMVAIPLGALRATDDEEYGINMTEEEFQALPVITGTALGEASAYNEVDSTWQDRWE